MNKKILALVLGGTMLATSVLAFAGCSNSHKHSYEISYKLADCDDEGYTIHTCTDCGYTYADEFIAPYGHALRTYYHIEDDEEETAVQTISRAVVPTDSALDDLLKLADELTKALSPEYELLDEYFFGKHVCQHDMCEFCDYVDPTVHPSTTAEEAIKASYLAMISGTEPEFYGGRIVADGSHVKLIISGVVDGSINVTGRVRLEFSDNEYAEKIARLSAECKRFDLVLPDSVTKIGNSAFGNCEKLERVYLPKNLATIGDNVFGGSSLDSVIIPKTLTSIGYGSFNNCRDLKVVYFSGTEDEWKKIDIKSRNDSLINASRYYYSETKPTKAGSYWHYVNEEPTKW